MASIKLVVVAIVITALVAAGLGWWGRGHSTPSPVEWTGSVQGRLTLIDSDGRSGCLKPSNAPEICAPLLVGPSLQGTPKVGRTYTADTVMLNGDGGSVGPVLLLTGSR
jgi:hypothetical protein